ncbi:DUF177 domain-containing protein [Paenibacillus sp. JX-17]|uniref:DUF177 domain-containing protein n=1 Tax=Paenibacillus lacisoli TaxID=3064525 RepID=A0ABT9CE52_9BACL|nr:DUF177 domain-containing protein [Paenibacillus sp. JX-17]MDO7905878.1 DUF177 domain-containing protein [Paenibacillus sp. JX-17]
MQLHFRKMASSGGQISLHESLDVSALVNNRKDITAISPLVADLSAISHTEGVIDVQGSLKAELDMLCSRCLKPMHEHLNIEFQEQFKQSANSDEDQEDDAILVEGESFDLAPYCEESFLMHVPFVPLCDEDCKGLCPTCGHDLNEGDCGCDNQVIDPRLAGLKDFFNK